MNTTRKQFHIPTKSARIGLMFLAAALVFGGCESRPRNENPVSDLPPIIFFSIDTLRAGHLSCYDYHRPTSPRIDSFAREAVLFRDAIAQAPTTAPAHMSIFTSLYPAVHRLTNFKSSTRPGQPLNEAILTLPQFIQAHGYLTVGLTGGAQLDGSRGFDRGFDYYGSDFNSWEGEMRPTIEGLTPIKETVKHWIRESREQGRPLFLFLHHYTCHDPYVKGPPEYREKFLDRPVPDLPRSVDDLNLARRGIRAQFFGKGDLTNPDHLQHYIALYDGGVYFSDVVFGEFIDLLKAEGLYDPALFILFSDHGEEFFEHGDYLHEQIFRETLWVPLIVKLPKGEYSGKTIAATVETLDILPTVAELLGLSDKLPPIQGQSLLPLIQGKPGYKSHPVSFSNCLKWVRFSEGGYTYTNWPSGNTQEWLFAEDDPEERINLAEVEEKVVASMRGRAQEIMEENLAWHQGLVLQDHNQQEKLSPELIQQLRSIGYLR